MRRLNGTEMKALFILSIVVPVGVLTTLRLTGILQGRVAISETITLDTIEWEFERPDNDVDIEDKLNATYGNNGLLASMYVLVVDYWNNSRFVDDHDFLRLIFVINSTSTSSNGFIEKTDIVVSKDHQSFLDWLETEFHSTNLSLTEMVYGYKCTTKALVELTGVNHPNKTYFRAVAEWSLLTPHTESQQVEVEYQLTYYNGTAYNKVIQPFQLKIRGS